jgi:hypothetical protein
MKGVRIRCRRNPYKITRSSAVDAGGFPAGVDRALALRAAGASKGKNSIFFEDYL